MSRSRRRTTDEGVISRRRERLEEEAVFGSVTYSRVDGRNEDWKTALFSGNMEIIDDRVKSSPLGAMATDARSSWDKSKQEAENQEWSI